MAKKTVFWGLISVTVIKWHWLLCLGSYKTNGHVENKTNGVLGSWALKATRSGLICAYIILLIDDDLSMLRGATMMKQVG